MHRDRDIDVIVVGSGAGALTAATVAADSGLAVSLIERASLLGGTSAFSGGVTWMPSNRWMGAAGISDSREEALEYILGLTQGREHDLRLIETYVDRAAEAIHYIADHTPADFCLSGHYSDYYSDRPGAKRRGRSLLVKPFASRTALGEWEDRVRLSPHLPRVTLDEVADSKAVSDPRNALAMESVENVQSIIARRERDGVRANGAALAAALVCGLLQREVTLTVNTRATDLVVEDGRITGVLAEQDGHKVALRARHGVVLGAGGYEWNPELVKAFLGVPELKPNSPPHNEGDGLLMGMRAGAALANMTVAWEYPVTYTGHQTFEGKPLAVIPTVRFEPGCVMVNTTGRRFTNEAVCYQDLPKLYRAYDPVTQSYPNERVWMIFDQDTRDTAIVADMAPGKSTPEWVKEADTIEGLAAAIEVSPSVLAAEIVRWNESCDRHEDPDFGRGTVWFEGVTTGGPDPDRAFARIDRAPFFAMPQYHGANGTAGGLRTDSDGRVVNPRGEPIPGLYAVGSTAASIFGPMYPGAGATLGQGVCFGYLAGLRLAAQAHETRKRPSVGARVAS